MNHLSWKLQVKRFWPYLAGAIVTPLIWGWFYGRRFKISLDIPISNPLDLWVDFAHIKALISGEWWPFGARIMRHIGAPFGPVYMSSDYPLPEQLQYFILRIIGFFSSNPFWVINLYYLLGFIFVVWATIYACRRLRISSEIGLVIGVLFAFLPYHPLRYAHIMLASYYLIPIATVLLVWLWSAKALFPLATGSKLFWKHWDRRSWFALGACLLIGWWHVYYAFFFCLFAGTAGVSAAWYRRRWQPAISAGIMLGLVAAALGVAMLPTFIGQLKYGKNHEVAHRQSCETEMYGLKLANLMVPVPTHRMSIFRKAFSARYQSGTPTVEGVCEYIGFVGVIGLLGILASVWMIRRQGSLGVKLSVLTATGIIYATIGGLSSLFAFLVTPMMRCPNRISPYLAFFGLLWVACIFQKFKTRTDKKWLYYTVLTGVLVFGIVDQMIPNVVFIIDEAEIHSDQTFIQAIEKEIPGGTVLQLPFVKFPEQPVLNEMRDYSHLRAYVYSQGLFWSYGALHGRPASDNIEALSREPLDLAVIRKAGYTGIYIDRFGYPGHKPPAEAQLIRELKQAPLESRDKRMCFFKL
jgi:phosphoglycerol transferase